MARWSSAAALLLAGLVLTACGAGGESGPTLDPEGPRAAFDAYRRAVREGDLTALNAVLSAEAQKGLAGAETEMVVEMLRSFLPTDETVTGVEVDGETATIQLAATDDGVEAKGRVRFVREDGRWKVLKENWNLGGGEPSEPSPGPDPAEIPDREPDGDWRLDCHRSPISDEPAAGRHGGEPFTVRDARIRDEILTLTDGDQFEWNGQFVIFLFIHRGEKALAGRTISIGPEKDWEAEVGVHVHFTRRGPGGALETDIQTEGLSLRLEFGEPAEGRLPGRIHLSYPDEEKSFVVGSFTAVLE